MKNFFGVFWGSCLFVFWVLFWVWLLFWALFGAGLAHFQCCQNALSMLLKVTFHVVKSDVECCLKRGDVQGGCVHYHAVLWGCGRINFRRRREQSLSAFFYWAGSVCVSMCVQRDFQ